MTHRIRALVVAVLAVLLALTGSVGASAAPADRLTGDVTARWWQVVLSLGVSFEDSLEGANCATVKDATGAPIVVAFGTFGGASGPRACTVPAGATIVLPAINNVWVMTDPAGPWKQSPFYDTIGEGRSTLRQWASTATASATIDGKPVAPRSIQSARFMGRGELFGYPNRLLPAVSAGYWLVVKLPAGSHTVTTYGAADGFISSTNYAFTVR